VNEAGTPNILNACQTLRLSEIGPTSVFLLIEG